MSKHETLSAIQREKGQTYAILTNLFGRFNNYIILGAILMLFCNDVLKFNSKEIGKILAILPLIGVVKFLFLKQIESFGKTKTLTASIILSFLPLVILFLTPVSSLTFWIFILLISAYKLFLELGPSTVWQPIMREITTVNDRGVFFSKMRFTFTFFGSITVAIVSFWIGETITERQYKILIFIVLLGTTNKLFWALKLSKLTIKNNITSQSENGNSWDGLKNAIKTSSLLRRPLLINSLLQLASFPLFILYMKNMLLFPSNLISFYIFITLLGSSITFLIWGKIADAIGFRPMLTGLLLINIIATPLIIFVNPLSNTFDSIWNLNRGDLLSISILFSSALIQGALAAGTGIAMTSIQHFYVKQKESLYAMNVQAFVSMVLISITFYLSGWYLQEWAIPMGSWPVFNELIHLDYIKIFHLIIIIPLLIIILIQVQKIVNTKPYYSVTDFFSSIKDLPYQNLLNQRKLYHLDEISRRDTAQWFGQHPSPLSVGPLIEFLTDPSYEVRIEAIRSLAKTNSEQAAEFLLEQFSQEEKRQLWGIMAWALGELNYQKAIPMLMQRIKPQAPVRVRAMAARALGKLKAFESKKVLHNELLNLDEPSLHIVASLTKALIDLDAKEYAKDILYSIYRLREREERYEIIYNICDWLEINNEWILRSKPESTSSDSLKEFIERMSDGWKNKFKSEIQILNNRDKTQLLELLKEEMKLINPENPSYQLFKILEGENDWSPLCIIAIAWLLLH
ncbi:MAG: hypothetical protein COA79_13195 [Planctomycetota bacterium]|nr:MAG: hypothetical protein COA79_13195 [Planctomycetota bacterium]